VATARNAACNASPLLALPGLEVVAARRPRAAAASLNPRSAAAASLERAHASRRPTQPRRPGDGQWHGTATCCNNAWLKKKMKTPNAQTREHLTAKSGGCLHFKNKSFSFSL
jgi:hypothetical protein